VREIRVDAVRRERARAAMADAEVGDEVTLIGAGLRAEELARKAGTIPYELTCRISKRVGRLPANAEQPMPASLRVVA